MVCPICRRKMRTLIKGTKLESYGCTNCNKEFYLCGKKLLTYEELEKYIEKIEEVKDETQTP